MTDDFEELYFVGISTGMVGDPGCLFCEHCRALPKDSPVFYIDGVTWCDCCAETMVSEAALAQARANGPRNKA